MMTKEISMENLYDGSRLEMNFKEVFITGSDNTYILPQVVKIYLDEEWTFSGKIDEIDWNNWGPGKIPVYIKQNKSFVDISEYCTSE